MDDKIFDQIQQVDLKKTMETSYIDYAMSVIASRALPDVRDGLKPVQRRVLYDMSELRLNHDKPHRKSARIVGDTMGKYHPHGDSSIYETLVVMSQVFKKGMPLVNGHGNFGSIEGDGAAAMRYTEARLQKVTQEAYLADLDKNVVDFMPNFDETEKEPVVLPVKVPNLLVNGAEGIAVGMAYVVWTLGMSKGNITVLAAASYFTPVLSCVFATFWIGAELNSSFWMGVVLVVVGSLLCWDATGRGMKKFLKAA